MLRLLNQYSRNRTVWFLLFLSAFLFEVIALYFQYRFKLAPCVLCIYQRCAIFGVLLSTLVAMISPKRFLFRFTAVISLIYCAVKGLFLAYEQAILQFQPSIFHPCPLNVEFPRWLPLNIWFPAVFESGGICFEKIWQFLTLEMSQWTMLIFACYIIIGVLIATVQPLCLPQKKQYGNSKKDKITFLTLAIV